MPAPQDVDKKDVRNATEVVRQQFSDEAICSLSEMVYRLRLESGDLGERMVREDKDEGSKLRARANGYNSIVRDMLKAMILLGHIKP